MIDILVYPVSGVMKLWHLFLHNALNLDDSIAWVLSIFGLVIVMRSLIAPFSVTMERSNRVSVLLRPALRALDEEYRTRTDKESVAEHQRKRKQLHTDHGYHPLAGCMPMLIQLMVFIGLYQLLLRMARPAEGLDVTEHAPIGFLTSDEVDAFLDSQFFNAPLPAYVAMDPAQHALLNTTRGDVLSVVLPLLIASILLTIFNLGFSLYRNSLTMQWSNKIARGGRKFLLVMISFVPVFLILLALLGPLPTAIVLYWVVNNLWTLAQGLILHLKINRAMPLPPEHHEQRHKERTTYKKQVQEEKDLKNWKKRQMRRARRDPERAEEIQAEIKTHEQERINALTARRAESKRLNQQKARARRALKREQRAKKKAEKIRKPGTTDQNDAPDLNPDSAPDQPTAPSRPEAEDFPEPDTGLPDTVTDEPGTSKSEKAPEEPN